MADAKFAKGIGIYKPNGKAPEWVLNDITLCIEDIKEMFNENKGDVYEKDGKHHLRLQQRVSKKGNSFIAINDFKPDANASKSRKSEPAPADDDLGLPF